jgi:hypothetical protein
MAEITKLRGLTYLVKFHFTIGIGNVETFAGAGYGYKGGYRLLANFNGLTTIAYDKNINAFYVMGN